MLEILRVVITGCDDNQHLVVGGVEQVPLGLVAACAGTWRTGPRAPAATPAQRCPASGRDGIDRAPGGRFAVTDNWGDTREYAVL